MIRVGFDQFTVMLRQKDKYENLVDWNEVVKYIIGTFITKARIVEVFSEIGEMATGIPEGYTRGYTCPKEPFYFAIAYNELVENMNIIVRFSGNAWSIYQAMFSEKYKEEITLSKFLQMIKSSTYEIRLSRVDPYVDFIDEGIDISKIQKSIEEERLDIRYGK